MNDQRLPAPDDVGSAAPEPDELFGEPWVVVTPDAFAALEFGCIPLPLETVPLVDELPLMVPASVPVVLHAARLRAIRAAIVALWIVFMTFSLSD
jgi:hypothetical protein